MLFQVVVVDSREARIHQTHGKTRVVLKQSLKQILLVRSPFLLQPLDRTLELFKYVMNVNPDARPELRRDFEIKKIKIALIFWNMRRVDKQHIVSLKRSKIFGLKDCTGSSTTVTLLKILGRRRLFNHAGYGSTEIT